MKVLLACEESQAVCIEFRKLGHEAYSNDIQECSGGHPEWHLQMDVFEAIKLKQWDLMIAFPPCTYLSNVGIGWFNEERYGDKARQRKVNRLEAMEFAKEIYNSGIPKICIENPVGYLNLNFRKPDQIIQPLYFGANYKKKTCLWLKKLKPLIYHKEDNLFSEKTIGVNQVKYFSRKTGKPISWNDSFPGSKDRARLRSKTFPGIAKAMAEQWGKES